MSANNENLVNGHPFSVRNTFIDFHNTNVILQQQLKR